MGEYDSARMFISLIPPFNTEAEQNSAHSIFIRSECALFCSASVLNGGMRDMNILALSYSPIIFQDCIPSCLQLLHQETGRQYSTIKRRNSISIKSHEMFYLV